MTENYPLEQLVTIKARRLEEARKVLEEKRRLHQLELDKLASTEKARDKVLNHRTEKLDQLREELDSGSTSTIIQRMKNYLKVVDEQLKQEEDRVLQQKKKVDAAEKAVESARSEMLKKLQEVEKLSLHREDWDKEMRREEEKKEALRTEEIGTSMHVIKRSTKHREPHE